MKKWQYRCGWCSNRKCIGCGDLSGKWNHNLRFGRKSVPGCRTLILKFGKCLICVKVLHSLADQRELIMRIFFALAVLVCRWWMVCGIGRCPLPGITAHAKFGDRSINWQNRTSFQEGDVVEYKCPGDLWNILRRNEYKLTCRSDGTWNKPLPRCGNCFYL